jgi:hypothetical protein
MEVNYGNRKEIVHKWVRDRETGILRIHRMYSIHRIHRMMKFN